MTNTYIYVYVCLITTHAYLFVLRSTALKECVENKTVSSIISIYNKLEEFHVNESEFHLSISEENLQNRKLNQRK